MPYGLRLICFGSFWSNIWSTVIEDAMRRETAVPQILGLGVFVIRLGMWRLAVYAWRSFG